MKTAEELFLEKFGNKITASESWVIRFAEEYANLLTERKEGRIKALESLCAIAGIPDSVVVVFSKDQITDEARQWAKEKINNLPPTTFTRT